MSTVPITHDGQLGGRLLGIVTSRDADLCEDRKEFLCKVGGFPEWLGKTWGKHMKKTCGKPLLSRSDDDLRGVPHLGKT